MGIQAYLGNSADLVLDHRNKANVEIKQVIWIFWFPSAYKSYVYTTLWPVTYATALCPENNVHTLI